MTATNIHSYGTPHRHARHLKSIPGQGLGPRERALWETVRLERRDGAIVFMLESIDVFSSAKHEALVGGAYRNDDYTDAVLHTVVKYIEQTRRGPDGRPYHALAQKLAQAFAAANALLPRTMGCAVCIGEKSASMQRESLREQRDSAMASAAHLERSLHEARAENFRLAAQLVEHDQSARVACWAIWHEPSHLLPGKWEDGHGGPRTFSTREAAVAWTRRLGVNGRPLITRPHRVVPLYPPPSASSPSSPQPGHAHMTPPDGHVTHEVSR